MRLGTKGPIAGLDIHSLHYKLDDDAKTNEIDENTYEPKRRDQKAGPLTEEVTTMHAAALLAANAKVVRQQISRDSQKHNLKKCCASALTSTPEKQAATSISCTDMVGNEQSSKQAGMKSNCVDSSANVELQDDSSLNLSRKTKPSKSTKSVGLCI